MFSEMQCSCSQGLSAPSAVDLLIVEGDGFPNPCGRVPVEGCRQDRPEDPRLGAVIGQRDANSLGGELVPPGAGNALDEPAQTQPAQVVTERSERLDATRGGSVRGGALPTVWGTAWDTHVHLRRKT